MVRATDWAFAGRTIPATTSAGWGSSAYWLSCSVSCSLWERSRSRRLEVREVKGDRVEVVVDTGHGTTTFDITATRAGRRLEVTTARGVVEVTEVTRGGTPVRTGRFMATRVVALVEHPALEATSARVEVETTRRLSPTDRRSGRARPHAAPDSMPLFEDEPEVVGELSPADEPGRDEAALLEPARTPT
jgi:hypothetical protein